MPGGPALTRPTLSFHSVVSYAGWPCAYPAYTFLPLRRFVCRMAMRLPGLHFPSTPSFRMPDGAALTRPTLSFHSVVSYAGWRCAYPAYTFLPLRRFVCRMAMRLPGYTFSPISRFVGRVSVSATRQKAPQTPKKKPSESEGKASYRNTNSFRHATFQVARGVSRYRGPVCRLYRNCTAPLFRPA
ncbi:hypothetical protein L351_08609 [Enterobacter sp. MGH 5]|nr:hypothetical protein L351_08609 [Enterobacter sp. MGH 5]